MAQSPHLTSLPPPKPSSATVSAATVPAFQTQTSLEHPPKVSDLPKVVVAQLAVLATTITEAKWDSSCTKIRHLLDTHDRHVHIQFLKRLLTTTAGPISQGNIGTLKSFSERLIATELDHFAYTQSSDILILLDAYLSGAFELVDLFDLRTFLDHFQAPFYVRLLVGLTLETYPDLPPSVSPLAQQLVTENLAELIDHSQSPDPAPFFRYCGDNISNLSFFLGKFLASPTPSISDKILIISSVNKNLTASNTRELYTSISSIVKKFLAVMSFGETIAGIEPVRVTSALVGDLLANIPQEQLLNEAVGLVLTEILFPGSQFDDKTQTRELAAMIATSLPHARAKGFEVNTVFHKLKQRPLWPAVFTAVVENINQLSPLSKTSIISLSQFFTTLDDELIDLFILTSPTWPYAFKLQFLLACKNLGKRVSVGAYDLHYCRLSPAVEGEVPSVAQERSLLNFSHLARLELDVVLNNKDDNGELDDELSAVFQDDYQNVPEYVALGCIDNLSALSAPLASKQARANGFRMVENLFVQMLDDNPSNPYLVKILELFATTDIHSFEQFLVNLYLAKESSDNLYKLLNWAIKHGVYDLITASLSSNLVSNFHNLLVLNVEAVRFGFTGFELWLTSSLDRLSQDRVAVLSDLLRFLEIQALLEYEHLQLQGGTPITTVVPPGTVKAHLHLTSVAAILQLLAEHKHPDLREKWINVQILCVQGFPRLINFGHGCDDAILANFSDSSSAFAPEVELEMKAYYQKMYNKEIEMKEIIELLTGLKNLNIPKNQDVFACMIHLLLDEYRFFPEYPLDALAITSVLFGSLIHFKLVEGLTLTIALHYILQSAQKPPESNMFKFSVQALHAFRHRLPEFGAYCGLLGAIPALASHQSIMEIVMRERAVNGNVGGGAGMGGNADNSPATPAAVSFRSLYVSPEVVGDVPQLVPSDSISDRVLFLVNNTTLENLDAKIDELTLLLKPSYFQWFANYLVSSRVRTEPNYHDLYASLSLRLAAPLGEHLFQVTVTYILQLLNSPANTTVGADLSPSDRNHLKNLGAWMGKITLARNCPIKQRNLSFKLLLVEAYNFEKLPLVLPFVCKVLDQAKSSVVFRPPNPWTLLMLLMLKELYLATDMKLNLKFEIEVLCNALRVDLQDIVPSNVIRSNNISEMYAINEGITKLALTPPAVQPSLVDFDLQGTTAWVMHPDLRRIFLLVVSKVTRDMLPLAVEKAASIAVVSTKALVLKDFAFDADVNRIRKAAFTMVTVLAERYAVASCSGTFAETVTALLLQELPQLQTENSPFEDLPEAIHDNMDHALAVVVKATRERATRDMDELLAQAVQLRRSHRSGEPFAAPEASRYALALPEPLGLRQSGVTQKQAAVYEGFGSRFGPSQSWLPQPMYNGQQQGPLPAELTLPPVSATGAAPSLSSLAPAPAPALAPVSLAVLQQSVDTLLTAITETSSTRLRDVPPDHPLKTILTQILVLCSRTSNDLLLKVAQFTVNALFTACDSDLACETLVLLLDKICDFSAATAKDVIWWLVHADDERKFNTRVISELLRVGLIQSGELNASLAKAVLGGNPLALTFAASLITKCALGQAPICLRSEFASTIEAIKQQAESLGLASDPAVRSLVEGLQATTSGPVLLNEQLGQVFAEWAKLLNNSCSEELQNAFIIQLREKDVLGRGEYAVTFFRTALEMSVAAFIREGELKQKIEQDFVTLVDAFARLIVRILVLQGDGELGRAALFRQVLSVVSLVLANEHENHTATFNERPYFRLFSTLMAEWSRVEGPAATSFAVDFYLILADFFHGLQPICFPGFTFAWVSTIAHRMFLPAILELPEGQGWGKFTQLLVDLLKFENTHIDGKQIPEVISVIYKGTVRILLVLLNDYPEYLVANHHQIVTHLPASFVQLRNVVLSAVPASITLPNPLASGLKMEKVKDTQDAPEVAPAAALCLLKAGLKKPIDNYLRVPSNSLFRTIYGALKLEAPKREAGIGYGHVSVNVELLSAVVLHVGLSAVSERQSVAFNSKGSHVGLLAALMLEASIEMQFQLMLAIVNQLRYPNSHTQWFSCIVLHFFGHPWGSKRLQVQQVITRVMVERMVGNKPQPWGLQVTFAQLARNRDYGLFDLPFLRATPELARMFEVMERHVCESK